MIAESVLLLSCVLFAWVIYTHYYKPYYVIKKTLCLPGPPPSLFYGNYSEIRRLGYLECLSKWSSRYGSTFVYYLGIMPIVVVTDPEIIKTIMVKNFDSFINRPKMPLLMKEEDEINELPFLRDDRWRRVRRILVRMFTSKRLKMMVPLIEERCRKLQQRMAAVSDDINDSVDVWEWIGPHTLGVILATGFGRDISTAGDDNALTKAAVSMFAQMSSMEGFSFKWLQTMLSHFPWSEHFIKFFVRRSVMAKSFDCMEQVALKLIKERRHLNLTAGNHVTQDLLQLMIEAHDESEKTKSEGYLSNGEIVGSMIEIILASYDTIRGTLSYTAYQLALNPSIQDHLVREIREYYDANPDASLYDVAENIDYVAMVLYESLRIFTFTPDTDRECNKTCVIADGLVIPEGIAISFPFACLHLNPEYWPNPSIFDPERFREQNYPKFAYLPFGEGPRHCIGKRLALLVARMSLVAMLKDYKFMRTTKTEVPLELTTDIFSAPKHGVYLSIVANPPH